MLTRLSCRWVRNPYPSSAYRYHGAFFQGVTIPFDDFGGQRYALSGRNVWQPDQPGVRRVVQVDQRSEVGIYRDQDTVR